MSTLLAGFALCCLALGFSLALVGQDSPQARRLSRWLLIIGAVLGIGLVSTGCITSPTSPCKTHVIKEVKQDTTKCTFAEGRWVCVTLNIYAPGGTKEVCQ